MANRGQVEAVTDSIFFGSIITADGDCGHEIGRCLLLGKKAMTNLNHVLESKGVTLPTKIHIVKAMVCPVVMYGCESWTRKKYLSVTFYPVSTGINQSDLKDSKLPTDSASVTFHFSEG